MYRNYIKRIIDVVCSIIGLIILLPFFLIISLIIKITDKGPIIYKQIRTGVGGNNFKIYKFKTMKDGKITRVGKLLRKTSIDELPQLYNVLKGDMSIVGPRPWIPEYYENFNTVQRKRVDIKPGIVGLAQVNGRKNIDIFKKIEYDINYVDNVNFLMDSKIVLKSFGEIYSNEGNGSSDIYIKKEIDALKNQNNISVK